jgi:hypothetical protein
MRLDEVENLFGVFQDGGADRVGVGRICHGAFSSISQNGLKVFDGADGSIVHRGDPIAENEVSVPAGNLGIKRLGIRNWNGT